MVEQKVKVLEFISKFAIGGTERQFVYFTKGMNRDLFDVRIGCFQRQGEFLDDIEALHLPIRAYPTAQFYHPRTIWRQLRFARQIRQEGIQLVHAYNWGPNIFAGSAAWMAGKSVVVMSVRDTGIYLSSLKKKTLFAACRLADCVLANCNAVRDYLIAGGVPERRIEVIRNGIVASRWTRTTTSSSIRQELGIETGVPVVTFVGRLAHGKGVEFLLEAIRILVERHPKIRLLVVGNYPYDEAYRKGLAEKAGLMPEQTIFAGMRNDVPALLHASNVFVLPSLSEGLSNVLLEGMAAGLPVVATNVGGNPEIVQDGTTGFLVSPKNATELAGAIGRLLENPAMARQFGEMGQARILGKFSVERMVRETEDLYLRLLERRHIRLIPAPGRSVRSYSQAS